MLIDWFTVGAQALNFLILVWLLQRFLYKPILNAIDAREKIIAAKLADADAKEADARKASHEFIDKNAAFDQQRAALMSKATDDAKEEGRKLLDDARTAADAASAKRQETLKSDALGLNQAIRRRTQQEVFAIARRTLTDLAGAGLEERIGETFLQRVRTMDAKVKETFAVALKTDTVPAVVRSAFEMPETQRAAVQTSLDEIFSSQIRVRFETAPDLVSGIELTADGQKLGWSIADYLARMENGVAELLAEHDKPQPKPAEKPVAEAARP